MWLWTGAHIFEILVFLATAVEAAALVYIYRLEKRQFEFQESPRIDLRVDIDFPEGYTTGVPCIWIENAGAGSGFIESAELIVRNQETQEVWEWKCKMAGTRKLSGFESVRVDLVSALRDLGKEAWKAGSSKVEIVLWASVIVLVGREYPLKKNPRTYRTSITSETGNLSELIPVPPP